MLEVWCSPQVAIATLLVCAQCFDFCAFPLPRVSVSSEELDLAVHISRSLHQRSTHPADSYQNSTF